MSVTFTITEGQLVRMCHGRPEDAADLTNRAACLKLFGFDQWDTGGGCTALGFERADSCQLLITDVQDNYPPRDNTACVDVGFYNREGNQVDYETYDPGETEKLCRVVIKWLEAQYDDAGGDAERSNGPKAVQS